MFKQENIGLLINYITVFKIKSEPGCCLRKCWLQKWVPHFMVVLWTWRNKVTWWTSFCAYPFFHKGNHYSKNIKVTGSKKLKKRRIGRFTIERGLSKEGQIKPASNAFTKNYETEGYYFSLSHYSIIYHFSILFKR